MQILLMDAFICTQKWSQKSNDIKAIGDKIIKVSNAFIKLDGFDTIVNSTGTNIRESPRIKINGRIMPSPAQKLIIVTPITAMIGQINFFNLNGVRNAL